MKFITELRTLAFLKDSIMYLKQNAHYVTRKHPRTWVSYKSRHTVFGSEALMPSFKPQLDALVQCIITKPFQDLLCPFIQSSCSQNCHVETSLRPPNLRESTMPPSPPHHFLISSHNDPVSQLALCNCLLQRPPLGCPQPLHHVPLHPTHRSTRTAAALLPKQPCTAQACRCS